jgi:HSP20 family protein
MHSETLENGGPATTPVAEMTRSAQCFRPTVDIVEDSQELRILADMPGVNSEAIDIDFSDGALTIHGHVPNRRGESAKFLWEEYGVGDFYRVFQIGEAIDASRISANYSDGVLTVHLPKVETVKPRKISVQVNK